MCLALFWFLVHGNYCMNLSYMVEYSYLKNTRRYSFMKKRFAIFMAVVMVFSGSYVLPDATAAETNVKTMSSTSDSWLDYTKEFKTEDTKGTKLGTSEDNPILIESEEQLAYLAKVVNEGTAENNVTCDKYFKLTKSLDLSSHYWTAIGINGQEFQGHFDGNGKVIQGLNMDELKTGRIFGLFGDVYAAGKGAGIKNLTVMGATIEANCVSSSYTSVVQNDRIKKSGYGGILAASIYGNHSDGKDVKPVIENCQVQGQIVCISDDDMYDDYTRESDAGGIAGIVSYAVIKSCAAMQIKISSYGGMIGGFAGLILDNSEISDCTSAGYVTGLSLVGGFSGNIQNGSVVESCHTCATASAHLRSVGGFSGGAVYTGENDTQPVIKNCTSTGLVYCNNESRCEPQRGSFIGWNIGSIQQCYATGTVCVSDSDNLPSGGFAGVNDVPTTNTSAACGTINDCGYCKWSSKINDVYQNNGDPDSISNILTKDTLADMTAYIHDKKGGHYGSFYSGMQTAKACKEGYTGNLICQYDKQTMEQGTSYTLHDGLEEHQWNDGLVLVEPKDGNEGTVLYTCQVCEETKTIKVSQWPLPSTTPTATPTATPTNKPTVKPTTTPTAKTTANPVKKITAKQQEKNSQRLSEKASAGWKDGKFNVTWGSVKGASGYDIYATLCTKKLNQTALVKTVSGTKTSTQLYKIT